MKTLMITLIVFLFVGFTSVNAESNVRTYSHLPLVVKEVLKSQLLSPTLSAPLPMSGYIFVEFYVNENYEIVITSLSSNDLSLGSYVVEVLAQMPELSKNCNTGRCYNIKAIVSYQ